MFPDCPPIVMPIGNERLMRPPLAVCHPRHPHNPNSQPHTHSEDHLQPTSTKLLLAFPSYWVYSLASVILSPLRLGHYMARTCLS